MWRWLLVKVCYYEILAGMWVRNGHQIRGQAMTYVQSHFCKSTIDVDIYLLQATAYLLPFIICIDWLRFFQLLFSVWSLSLWRPLLLCAYSNKASFARAERHIFRVPGALYSCVVIWEAHRFCLPDLASSHWVHSLCLDYFVCVGLFSLIISACMLYYCNTVRWAWLHWGLSGWLTTLLQCFDTVGWVLRPVNTVGHITYIVLVQTLNHARLINQSECLDVKNYKWWLNLIWHRMLYSCTHLAAVGVRGLK